MGTQQPAVCSVQLLSHVWLFATPWTVARQASLSITNSRRLLRLMSIASMMPSSRLSLCRPLLLLPSVFPSISFPGVCFCTPAKTGLLCFLVVGRNSRLFHGMWKVYEIRISVSINTTLLEPSSIQFVHILSVAASVLKRQSWIFVTDTVWPRKLKIFTVWPFTYVKSLLTPLRFLKAFMQKLEI